VASSVGSEKAASLPGLKSCPLPTPLSYSAKEARVLTPGMTSLQLGRPPLQGQAFQGPYGRFGAGGNGGRWIGVGEGWGEEERIWGWKWRSRVSEDAPPAGWHGKEFRRSGFGRSRPRGWAFGRLDRPGRRLHRSEPGGRPIWTAGKGRCSVVAVLAPLTWGARPWRLLEGEDWGRRGPPGPSRSGGDRCGHGRPLPSREGGTTSRRQGSGVAVGRKMAEAVELCGGREESVRRAGAATRRGSPTPLPSPSSGWSALLREWEPASGMGAGTTWPVILHTASNFSGQEPSTRLIFGWTHNRETRENLR
jgi:hypothetical protein